MDPIGTAGLAKPVLDVTPQRTSQAPKTSFSEILKSAVDEVVASQQRADSLINDFATGGDVDVHEVVIAAEQANLTLSLAIQVRNKALEAYQEIQRIQV